VAGALADADGAFAVSLAHREVDATEVVDLDDLHLDHVADVHHVLDAVHALFGQLGDLHHAVLVREDLHERAEGHDPGDGALVDLADLDLLREALDLPDGGLHTRGVLAADEDRTVLLDVDGRTGLGDDRVDHLAARPNDRADLRGV